MSEARPYITCKELIDFIADYLDGDLPAASREDFERHLAVCDSCRNYLATYRETILASRAAATYDDALADGAPEDLIRAILHSRKT